MENKQGLQQWLEKRSYTKEDILHIAGKQLPDTPEKPYTEKDILNILDRRPELRHPVGLQALNIRNLTLTGRF